MYKSYFILYRHLEKVKGGRIKGLVCKETMAPCKEGNETGKSDIKRVDKCKTITVPNGLLVHKTT